MIWFKIVLWQDLSGANMELRSFIAGILCLYGVQVLLPVFGIAVAVTTPNPLINLIFGVVALVMAYYLFRN
jgi:hypothetical protein